MVAGPGHGTVESIPLVRDGMMYIMTSTGVVLALDATNGDVLWEYKHRPDNAQGAARHGRKPSRFTTT